MLTAMFSTLLHGAGAAPLVFPWAKNLATRTGGPDDDDDDDEAQLRRLMPILAAVIAIAVIFGG